MVRDEDTGDIVELRCSYDPESKGGSSPDGRRVRGTLHWVSAQHAIPAEVRLYDTLFRNAYPDEDSGPVEETLNPDSLTVIGAAQVEPSLAEASPGDRFQFERQGYFCADLDSGGTNGLVFNRTVPLRDSWARIQNNQAGA